MCAAASAILAALAAPVPRQVQTLPGVEKLSLSDSAGVSAIASANRRDAAIFLNVASRTSVRHPWLLQGGLGSADSPAADAWTLAELSLTVPATGDDVGGSRPSASVGRRLQQWRAMAASSSECGLHIAPRKRAGHPAVCPSAEFAARNAPDGARATRLPAAHITRSEHCSGGSLSQPTQPVRVTPGYREELALAIAKACKTVNSKEQIDVQVLALGSPAWRRLASPDDHAGSSSPPLTPRPRPPPPASGGGHPAPDHHRRQQYGQRARHPV